MIRILAAGVVPLIAIVYGCASAGGGASSTVKVDGSSTVFLITAAMAEEFHKTRPDIRVYVGLSGTGGGFKKFINGEIDICDASRFIKPAERDAAKKAGMRYIEIPVAFDGLSVVVNKRNDFANSLTVAELKRIWEPSGGVKTWRDVRPEWPNKVITLYGPGQDSGTFDYFTEVIVGKSGASRADYSASENDNQIVLGVAGDRYALGYFGYAYYEANRDQLKIVPIDAGEGPVMPTPETIADRSYSPLSRPLLIYVRRDAADRPEVNAFVTYYLSEESAELVREVGYVPLSDEFYELARNRFEDRVTGSMLDSQPSEGRSLKDLLSASRSG